jgi:hypothetical protein
LIAILLCPLIPLVGQDIDANPSIEKRSLSTIADQISDASERAAFVKLFVQAPPAEMRARAQAFLARFPQSAFLAQAYEVAARASFDLESSPCCQKIHFFSWLLPTWKHAKIATLGPS